MKELGRTRTGWENLRQYLTPKRIASYVQQGHRTIYRTKLTMCPYVYGTHTWVFLAVEILVLKREAKEALSVLETNAVFFCIDNVL